MMHIKRKTIFDSILSFVMLGITIILAIGSFSITGVDQEVSQSTKTYVGDGIYNVTYNYRGEKESYTGKQDKYGKWQGLVSRKLEKDGKIVVTTEVNYKDGKRHGRARIVSYENNAEGEIYYTCYKYNHIVPCEDNKSAYIAESDTSGFQILKNKYQWYLQTLNSFGFDSTSVEAYMDTIETLLYAKEFEEKDFLDNYDDALGQLDGTLYDSIVELNTVLWYYYGLERLKDSEFRLAVFDKYLNGEDSTYKVVTTKYRNYMPKLYAYEVTDEDFSGFCQDFDSIMMTYGQIDINDTFFTDTMDARIYAVLSDIYSTETDAAAFISESIKSAVTAKNKIDLMGTWDKMTTELNNSQPTLTSGEVATIVLNYIILAYSNTDIIMSSIREAWLKNKGLARLPTVTTEQVADTSETAVNLLGTIISDGGSVITERGFVWATYYNPTINDEVIISGVGSGEFEAQVSELDPNTGYYARAYAKNSRGTGYGNCIKIIPSAATFINKNKLLSEFNVFPNPAREYTTIQFRFDSPANNWQLKIVDLHGRVMYAQKQFSFGENTIKLNVSNFKNGVYICSLINSENQISRKFLVTH